jgi:hypothetical protein
VLQGCGYGGLDPDQQRLWWQKPFVNGVERNVLPDGTEGIGLAFAGRHQVNQLWCDGGSCD